MIASAPSWVDTADGPMSLPSEAVQVAVGQVAVGGFSSTRYRGNKSTSFSDLGGTTRLKERAKKARQKRRGIHSELVRKLENMADGQHGFSAAEIGRKWFDKVQACGGKTLIHEACDQPVYVPHSCDFPLCPWYQAARARRQGKRIGELFELGYFKEPKFWTFNPPNVADYGGATKDLGKVLTKLHRRSVTKACRGGFRAREATVSERHGNWNVHAHELVDSGWVAPNPVWDITFLPFKSRAGGKWKIVKKHAGLAREFTLLCQSYALLKSPREDFDIDNPEHWYFVNLKVANRGSVKELAKYATKGAEVVAAGPGKIVDYMLGSKGQRLVQGFGSLYGMKVDEPDDRPAEADLEEWWEKGGDDQGKPEAKGECPNPDCPNPGHPTYKFIQYGVPDGYEVGERDKRTGSCVLHDAVP
jgi:hypothetical protein